MRASLLVLLVIVGGCLLAPVYARHVSGTDPLRSNVMGVVAGAGPVIAEGEGGLGTVPIGPGWRGAYLLGADGLGRDVAARLLYGGRTTLWIASCATVICLVLGVAAGVLAGAAGGWVDSVISAGLDLLWAFPVTLLAISLSLVLLAGPLQLGPFSIREESLALPILILGVVYAPYVARPVRSRLVELRSALFIEAAHATGGGWWHVLWRHMLPQLRPLLLGLAPVVAAGMLLTEALLSVLGIGVQAPGASWGTLLEDGRAVLHQRPMVVVAPGLAIAVTVLALNALAEALGARRGRAGD